MAKPLDTLQTADAQDEAKRQRKKQAKREAKLMLELEDAKKDVRKAEQKFARAQSNLEASRVRLHELEEQLAQIRNKQIEQPESSAVADQQKQSYDHLKETEKLPDQGESYEDSEAVAELHRSSLPPVEGQSELLSSDSSTTAVPNSEARTDQPESPNSTAEGSQQ
jgi:septal ring factor EnvC (AmiA/AmiB activator)